MKVNLASSLSCFRAPPRSIVSTPLAARSPPQKGPISLPFNLRQTVKNTTTTPPPKPPASIAFFFFLSSGILAAARKHQDAARGRERKKTNQTLTNTCICTLAIWEFSHTHACKETSVGGGCSLCFLQFKVLRLWPLPRLRAPFASLINGWWHPVKIYCRKTPPRAPSQTGSDHRR